MIQGNMFELNKYGVGYIAEGDDRSKLLELMELSPVIGCREWLSFMCRIPGYGTTSLPYNKRMVYIYPNADRQLVEKAVELISEGCTHVMLNRKSIKGRKPIKSGLPGFRTRRSYITFTYELKDEK